MSFGFVAVTVIAWLPVALGVTVTVPLLIDAVAFIPVPVLVGLTLNVHALFVLAVNVFVVGKFVLPLVALNVTPQAFAFTVHVNVPVLSL